MPCFYIYIYIYARVACSLAQNTLYWCADLCCRAKTTKTVRTRIHCTDTVTLCLAVLSVLSYCMCCRAVLWGVDAVFHAVLWGRRCCRCHTGFIAFCGLDGLHVEPRRLHRGYDCHRSSPSCHRSSPSIPSQLILYSIISACTLHFIAAHFSYYRSTLSIPSQFTFHTIAAHSPCHRSSFSIRH